jgi:hybrid cluster-associated redox disulfide protein
MMAQIQHPTAEALGEMTITDVLERWPRTADVFHDHAMACVGCAVAPFYSITDAALVYGLSPQQFAAELLAAIQQASQESETHNE